MHQAGVGGDGCAAAGCAGGAEVGLGAGAGSCWAITEGGGVTGASPLAALSVTHGVPSLTLSPTLTRIASTVPSAIGRHVHGGLVALQRDQRIVGLDRVARLDVDLDHRDVLEVPDVGNLDLDRHRTSLPGS